MKDVMDYFSEGSERKVTPTEFKHFWASCTDEEKEYYKTEAKRLLGR